MNKWLPASQPRCDDVQVSCQRGRVAREIVEVSPFVLLSLEIWGVDIWSAN
jgi:hypothetical protein